MLVLKLHFKKCMSGRELEGEREQAHSVYIIQSYP